MSVVSVPDMMQVRRVLIIKMSALGDILHALPVSAALKEAYPHLEITWAVEEPFVALLEGNPYLHNLLVLPKLKFSKLKSAEYRRNYFGRLKAARAQKFDLALDLQGLTKSAIVALGSGAPVRLGYHWLREAAGLVERRLPKHPDSVHIVDQYLDVARYLGAVPKVVKFPFYISAEDTNAVDALLREANLTPDMPFISINPASAQVIKQWNAAHFAELIDRLKREHGLPSVLVTADKAVAAQVADAATESFLNLCGRTNLKQLAAVIKRSAVHVCGDTGSSPLAVALERPVVTLVGPTDPDRIHPYGQRDNVLSHREFCGTNCDWHHCEFARPRCLDAITVDEVLAKTVALVSSKQVPLF